MAPPRTTLGDPQVERVSELGRRKIGVTVPDVIETFGVVQRTAQRYVAWLVKQRILKRTQETRRRLEVYGVGWPGRPAVVYRYLYPYERNR